MFLLAVRRSVLYAYLYIYICIYIYVYIYNVTCNDPMLQWYGIHLCHVYLSVPDAGNLLCDVRKHLLYP